MTNFIRQEENVTFVEWLPKGKKAREGSYVIDEGKTLEGLVQNIKDSDTYGKVYTLKVKGVDTSLIVTGKKSLNDGMGYGEMVVDPVNEGDIVQLTFVGMYKTKGKDGYKILVAVARAK